MPPPPKVTLGLVTYEQEAFVAEAVRAALAQTHEPLEIVICDDASPDRTFEVACEVVESTSTRHSVRLHRNERNLGIGNFNQLMSLATGELIVIAHGDDISLPHRVSRLVQVWQDSGASMVTSNGWVISEEGTILRDAVRRQAVPPNGLIDIATKGWNASLWGALLAWHRDVFNVFGPLDPERSAVSSDWILPFRAAALKGIRYIDEPLVKIREHPKQKQKRFLDDSTNELAKVEAQAASQLVQYLYMLDEAMQIIKERQLQPPEVVRQTLAGLSASIFRESNRWRRARNQLLSSGFRSQWNSVRGDKG